MPPISVAMLTADNKSNQFKGYCNFYESNHDFHSFHKVTVKFDEMVAKRSRCEELSCRCRPSDLSEGTGKFVGSKPGSNARYQSESCVPLDVLDDVKKTNNDS